MGRHRAVSKSVQVEIKLATGGPKRLRSADSTRGAVTAHGRSGARWPGPLETLILEMFHEWERHAVSHDAAQPGRLSTALAVGRHIVGDKRVRFAPRGLRKEVWHDG